MVFSIFDLAIGAIGIRLSRKYKKIRNIPDLVFVTENLAFGGGTPYNKKLKSKIDIIIDLRAEEAQENVDNSSLEYHKMGFTDGSIPTDSQIDQIHKLINEGKKRDKTIFVHCNLGRGRATLTTMSYLLNDGYDWETALKKIRTRRYVYLNKKQWNFLKKRWNNK